MKKKKQFKIVFLFQYKFIFLGERGRLIKITEIEKTGKRVERVTFFTWLQVLILRIYGFSFGSL